MLPAPTPPPAADTCPADATIRAEALRLLDAGLSPRRTAVRLRCTVRHLATLLTPAGVVVSGQRASDWPAVDAAVELTAFAQLAAGWPFTRVCRDLGLPIEHVQRLWDLS